MFAALGQLCVRDIESRGKTPDKKMLAHYCRLVAQWLTSDAAKPSLILSGNAGTGKTTIARAVNDFFNEKGIFSKCLITATDLNENFMLKPDDSDRKFCGGSGCRWLIIDDIGEEQTDVREYGNIRSPFINVVADRYDKGLPLMITTNLDFQKLEDKYGVRTADRLRGMAGWIPFNGSSYR